MMALTMNVAPSSAQDFAIKETPSLADEVAAGTLPPLEDRLPFEPYVADMEAMGQHGGQLRLLMGRAKDIRLLVVYGYARLAGYAQDLSIQPDILRHIEVREGREFTLHLRPGHKWSDGSPFTTEDFRFYWDDIANNEEVSPSGLPSILRIGGRGPQFDVIDDVTVRYTWDRPNPYFLPALARASPFYLYRPAHYMKKFHASYQDPEELARMVEDKGQRNWVSLMTKNGRQYRNNNPALPTLQPWVLVTKPPAERFIFKRNPYYHRIDSEGRQLPYIDEVAITIASAKLISAKTGSGESDLQARSLSFSDYTFLKQGEKINDFTVNLWHTAKGAHMALFPNMNTTDPEWQPLFRNVEFRRALSMATDRHEINQVIYFGLAREGNNSPLPQSPLYNAEFAKRWSDFNLTEANRILDDLGLTERDSRNVRLLPDGRPMEIIVETAGEDTEQADVLELVHDSWLKAGIKIYTKPLQREVLRNRIFAGTTLISVWFGLENGIPTPDTSPEELAPTNQEHFQWPKWGQFYQTNGKAGEAIDMDVPRRLASLNESWVIAEDSDTRRDIWNEMLDLYTDNVFSIGLASGVRQPVAINNRLHNVPTEGIYNWDPGAHFGIYRPDTFWFDDEPQSADSGN
ncbi:MAG: ABC transporter substrate-binding protein [Rhodospirillales bacterium]|nr:ABC transporter substrate-binding protein [Rhodospirillales bacterium]MBT4040568.1 ABC transporter substrate-binding protein [Rhodospirillales bacterium]MBT4627013.1 ABC transporter substrate-binding protein [Rhodospirillales bacterium]MBT5352228.1 ABC transporter substrate-binding protein [Rhodospirillales bacterium]MBT5520612.1 ABC transporter substrate-binding protein [Rhodospirillales bacterium]